MTNEQAIDLLDNLIGFVEDSRGNDYDSALKMAIEALTHFNSIKTELNDELSCSEKPNRSDTIYRQDVYDLIDNWDEPMISRSAFRCDVEDLPSAQTEQLTCEGCKYEKNGQDLCFECCRGCGDMYEER